MLIHRVLQSSSLFVMHFSLSTFWKFGTSKPLLIVESIASNLLLFMALKYSRQRMSSSFSHTRNDFWLALVARPCFLHICTSASVSSIPNTSFVQTFLFPRPSSALKIRVYSRNSRFVGQQVNAASHTVDLWR